MSISDWSSDVCSSDLLRGIGNHVLRRRHEDAVHHCPLKSRCSLEIDTPENRSRPESFAARNQRTGVFPLRRRTFLAGSFPRSEEHTSDLQSLLRISHAVLCLKYKTPIDYSTERPTAANQFNTSDTL